MFLLFLINICLLPPTACDCGTRLCDELTGQCICPPRTIRPECVVCEPQTFACHPLVGCEDCNCSRTGIQDLTEPGCNLDSGQCRWAKMSMVAIRNRMPFCATVNKIYCAVLLYERKLFRRLSTLIWNWSYIVLKFALPFLSGVFRLSCEEGHQPCW